jgi:hypothetical protein
VPDATYSPDPHVVAIDTATCKVPEGAKAGSAPAVMAARFIVLSPASPHALVVGDVYTAELWVTTSFDPPAVELSHVLETERAQIFGAVFSADGSRVAVFGSDGKLQTFETASGGRLPVVQVTREGQEVTRATFLADGRRVLVALKSEGSQAALVDTDSGAVVRRFE